MKGDVLKGPSPREVAQCPVSPGTLLTDTKPRLKADEAGSNCVSSTSDRDDDNHFIKKAGAKHGGAHL